jgi:hypothetical protein
VKGVIPKRIWYKHPLYKTKKDGKLVSNEKETQIILDLLEDSRWLGD